MPVEFGLGSYSIGLVRYRQENAVALCISSLDCRLGKPLVNKAVIVLWFFSVVKFFVQKT